MHDRMQRNMIISTLVRLLKWPFPEEVFCTYEDMIARSANN